MLNVHNIPSFYFITCLCSQNVDQIIMFLTIVFYHSFFFLIFIKFWLKIENRQSTQSLYINVCDFVSEAFLSHFIVVFFSFCSKVICWKFIVFNLFISLSISRLYIFQEHQVHHSESPIFCHPSLTARQPANFQCQPDSMPQIQPEIILETLTLHQSGSHNFFLLCR